ncbi:hypothetical protein [Microlunatus phosphovorus]|nr:hypothetical protein [Microlunatus phosphovorus]
MGIDAALMMLLRWFGSVALIILALAVVTLLIDRLRNRLTQTSDEGEISPPVHQLPPPVLLRPRAGESHAAELPVPAPLDPAPLDPAPLDPTRRTPASDAGSRSDVVWEPEDVRAG